MTNVKKDYVTPEIDVTEMGLTEELLAGSGSEDGTGTGDDANVGGEEEI